MGTYLSTPKTEKETEFGHGPTLSYGMCGMQGWRRTMEDAHICAAQLHTEGQLSLFGVFDGHGGAEVAQFCAKYLVRELQNLQHFRTGDYDKALKEVFHKIDEMLGDEAYAEEIAALRSPPQNSQESDPESQGHENHAIVNQLREFKRMVIQSQLSESMLHAGCTALVVLKSGNTLHVANAGDSRGVLCRAGRAVALSFDHKPMNKEEKQRIEAAGGNVSNAAGVPRVNGNLNLSRAIGDLKYKNNKALPPEAQIITAHPDVRVFELSDEDQFFLLACDGIWDVMTNEEAVVFVSHHLSQGLKPYEIASLLTDHCLAEDPKVACGVGCDNMTAIIVVLHDEC